jgi:DNA-binding response OmpR family regulator
VTVIACARESTVEQRVRGLRAGLDGWIDKDCHPHEVLARVQAIVRARRGRRVAARPAVRSGALHVDATRYDAVAGGRSAGLTTREFEVFVLLLEHRGDVLTREQIYAGVWGAGAPIGDRSVDIFVSRIRLKLKRISPGWSYLHTHIGAGYRFEAERDPAVALTGPAAEELVGTRSDAIDAELNEMMERASRRRADHVRALAQAASEQSLALA